MSQFCIEVPGDKTADQQQDESIFIAVPALLAAGIVDRTGKAKYTGLHSMRHFYASWRIHRHVDGGLELPLKVVQARLGHASIQMTADVYGHLFPHGDDGAELAAAEKAFLS